MNVLKQNHENKCCELLILSSSLTSTLSWKSGWVLKDSLQFHGCRGIQVWSLNIVDTRCFHWWRCCLRSVSRLHRPLTARLPTASTSTFKPSCITRSRTGNPSSAKTPSSIAWYVLQCSLYKEIWFTLIIWVSGGYSKSLLDNNLRIFSSVYCAENTYLQ